MAENNNTNEVSIGVKSNSSSAQQDINKLTKEVAKLERVMTRLSEYDALIRRVTKTFSEMAQVDFDNLDASLDKLPSILTKVQTAFDNINVDKFNESMERVQKATSQFNGIYKKLGDMAGIDLTGLSGNIDFSGLSNLTNTLTGINTASFGTVANGIRKITESYNMLNNMKLSDSTQADIKSKLTSIAETYGDFINRMSGYDASKIASMLRAINNIPKAMEKFKAIDMDNVETQFTSLSGVIRSFIATLKEGSGELNSLATILNKVGQTRNISGLTNIGKQVDNLGNKAEKTRRKLSNMLSFGRVYAFYNQLRHFGSGFINMINQSIDFAEIENYFSMAMKNMRGEAMKFQNELSNMYGAAMPDMMKAQATFKNMLGSLGGLSEELSYKLSEDLTKMSLDYASLYNTTFESAITKMEAALSKQVRPIRSQSGYDITQSVLGQTMQNIGINDRVIAQMSEIEKRLLIVITLQNQMYNSGAVGDYGRTIKISGFTS